MIDDGRAFVSRLFRSALFLISFIYRKGAKYINDYAIGFSLRDLFQSCPDKITYRR